MTEAELAEVPALQKLLDITERLNIKVVSPIRGGHFCQNCGTLFRRTFPWKLYCSHSCAQKQHKRRAAEPAPTVLE